MCDLQRERKALIVLIVLVHFHWPSYLLAIFWKRIFCSCICKVFWSRSNWKDSLSIVAGDNKLNLLSIHTPFYINWDPLLIVLQLGSISVNNALSSLATVYHLPVKSLEFVDIYNYLDDVPAVSSKWNKEMYIVSECCINSIKRLT